MSHSPITCHVLDASRGTPASGIRVQLECLSLAEAVSDGLTIRSTNEDGRCTDLLSSGSRLSPGVYKMTFFTEDYFKVIGIEAFYPLVEITFNRVDSDQHYHIPLLLSPYSYTTYRGS
ncbi:hydroxyisourate hydrolase [Tremella mesenterica]|uniref:5-hydroxyisourate hydrolase n=1 Tax=Tremella mesenterica TaxID=5217 RepID=A0A4Q1BJE5_TREME|nr:hydroxyisourate hydrolase [Tremella mesenterica]